MTNGFQHLTRVATAGALLATLTGTTAFAATKGMSGNHYDMTSKDHIVVTQVELVSTTQIDLMSKDAMSFAGKTITIRAVESGMTAQGTMGSDASRAPLTAKYDVAKGGFVLEGMSKLTPGVRYEVTAPWAKVTGKKARFDIVDLVKAVQLGANQIELVYNEATDPMSATTPANYWIQSNQATASGIANLGKNDKVTPTNGLTAMDVKISPVGHSDRKYILTFAAKVTPGVTYKVIPCAVDVTHESGYMAGNFNSSSQNVIVGQ